MSDPNEVEEENAIPPEVPSGPARQTLDDNPGVVPTPIVRTESGELLLPVTAHVVFYMPFMAWLLVELHDPEGLFERVVTCLN